MSFVADTEVTLELEANSTAMNCLRWYAASFDQDDPRNSQQAYELRLEYSKIARCGVLERYLSTGRHYYYYQDAVLEIQVVEYPEPVQDKGEPELFKKTKVNVLQNRKSRAENLALLDRFLEESQTAFFKNAEWGDTDEDWRVGVLLYNSRDWSMMSSFKARPISTVYLDGEEEKVLQRVQDFVSKDTEEMYRSFGIPYKYNMLFHGPPGSGKTTLASALASELRMDMSILTLTSKTTDADLMFMLNSIRKNSILILEDLDTLFVERKAGDEHKSGITFSGLLNAMDGLASVYRLIIIMTTNYPQRLDKALLRPGRLDYSYEFKYASPRQIRQVFLIFLPKQAERVDQFLAEVKHLKVTTAMLQKFLFGHRKDPNILDHLPELVALAQSNTFEKPDTSY